ncbi:probable trehalase [Camellia sinensis]|nr:probable trehalase [Camellia sinensis]
MTTVIENNVIHLNNNGQRHYKQVNEIKQYLDARYVSAIGACWRIFEFEIQKQTPSIEHLQYHLLGQKFVIFNDNDHLHEVIDQQRVHDTMLTKCLFSSIFLMGGALNLSCRGLLASKMYETAKGIVTNLVSLIDEFGHVLNGARAYYTNRSEPPLLSAMVYDIYTRTGDVDFARKSLPALLKEHKFWNSEIHSVIIHDAEGCNRTLSRYYAMWNKPRPESSTIDIETASKLMNDSAKQHLYRELASTAESGWDFSTRWMRNGSDLTTLVTSSIMPVDLNAFILKMELDIAFLANVTGDCTISVHFQEAAQARKQAMNSVFWNAEMGQWLDYWLSNGTTCKGHTWEASNQNRNIFASNFVPLWIELFNSDCTLVEQVMQSLQSSGLIRAVGIATSLTNSGQQWDFPNGWAPLQHMIVEGLARSGSKEARSMAEDIAVRWIRTNYVAYKKSGAMHEKYDVEKCGEFGGGGEYIPQTGFGWSNGVVLAFLEEFGWPQDLKIDCN